jgi:hypothetical protein
LEHDTESVDVELEEKNWTSPFARVLMTNIDLESENWGKTRHGWDLDPSVLLLREDRKDLSLAWAKHISCYCLDVLTPLCERVPSGEIYRQDTLNQITCEKAAAWKLVDASTSITAEPIPQRGFVRRLGSTRWENEKQNSRILELMDEILKAKGRP